MRRARREERSRALQKRLRQFPRVSLSHLPTPLLPAPRLTEALGGPPIYFKRDDLTGLAFGGNKARKLEYVLADARAMGADCVVVAGALQSNMARMTAAAARWLGLDPILILSGFPSETPETQGNILLDELLGAQIIFLETADRWDVGAAVDETAASLVRKGRRPYVIPLGGSSAAGVLGYVSAAIEIESQLEEQRCEVEYVVLATGTGGTQAGLALGSHLLGAPWKPLGISVSRQSREASGKVLNLVAAAAQRLGESASLTEARVLDDYIGPGYGVMTAEARTAIKRVAELEGVFLDPVYTGKAMAGLIDLVERGEIGKSQGVLFLHTGGTPALFAYAAEVAMKTEDRP